MMILARSSSFSYKTRLGVQKMESLLRRRSWFGVQAKESQEWTSGIGAALFFFGLSYPIDNVVRSFFIPKGKKVFLNALFLGVMTATSQLPTKLHCPECPSQAGTEPQKDAAAAAAVLTSVPEDANEVGPAL